tara:strand:+ start:239 stop:883 length:645 start_codon:yes stop_codon:yes gene_type:complete
MTEIPRFQINEIYIPEIKVWETYIPQLDLIYKPVVDIPGCVRVHRNNKTSLIDNPKDEYGTYTECGHFDIPSFEPLQYTPNTFTYTQAASPNQTQEQYTPPPLEPPPYIPPKEDEPLLINCPGPENQRVGDFRNEKRLERVISHKRSEDGSKCITLYEDVPFINQYIPETSVIVSTAIIGLVAASSPLILNIIKPAIKNIVKKLTKKKEDKPTS